MYSSKENVNILTALLTAYGVKHAVVCPGSRNAPIVHNLDECPDIACYPVTDERSAGFYALGMAAALGEPVAVCVTSGSALLNLAPAVAEAFYRRLPLIVVSADRPKMWIDQLEGQTIVQEGALGTLVAKSVSLIEPHDDDERWYCERLATEALVASRRNGGSPVHINVPISKPLFRFDVESLPSVKKVETSEVNDRVDVALLSAMIAESSRPMIVIGQMPYGSIPNINALRRKMVVVGEAISMPSCTNVDTVLAAVGDDTRLLPDLIIYIGDTLVSNRLKNFLRKAREAKTVRISNDARLVDTFKSTTMIMQGNPAETIAALNDNINTGGNDYYREWQRLLDAAQAITADYTPRYSQMSAVKIFEESLEDMDYGYALHYANSSAVRLANIYAAEHVYCNRGVNGIEGCLSAASGHSVVVDDTVFCVIGDLAFFYDQNALWNTNLRGNLRILLLNNHCGGIFNTLNHLDESRAKDRFVAARHNVDARGICTQNDIGYLSATNTEELRIGIAQLLTAETNRPMLLEVFTDDADDTAALQEYYKAFSNLKVPKVLKDPKVPKKQ